MAKFSGFLDNLAQGALNPKGNLADFRHASRTFVDDSFRLAPKAKFLFHTAFTFGPRALATFQSFEQRHKLEAGILVKSADLPKYSAVIDTRKKYNRVKHVQTSIEYSPVNITFHDDNLGITTAMLEAYYRYYFKDGHYGTFPSAFKKSFSSSGPPSQQSTPGDNTYAGPELNRYRYGLDNDSTDPFFTNIQISQLSRHTYTTYTLVNPIIESWGHDNVDYSDGAGTMTNQMTVKYEAVWYDRGPVSAGVNGDPKGFGSEQHYDRTPSPITLAGGGNIGLGGILGAGVDLFDYARTGKGFSSPLAAGLAAANLIGNVRGLTSEGARAGGFSVLKDTIGDISGSDVSGVANTIFPK